ncbi:MAG: ABC transporter ATP-binding protein [Bacillus sp. (in: firmicutes)]
MENEWEKPVIQIRNLNKYFGGEQVLQDINLDVYKGQIIGYIGTNGAGKSTTIKIMLGLIHEYTGYVSIFGEDLAYADAAYKKKIGYVPEVAELYEQLTAQEYLLLIGQLYGMEPEVINSKAADLLEILGAQSVYYSRISSFSKGMKQKLMLVAGFMHDPDILFLDEPLSGLDANSMAIIKEILLQLSKEGKTIFYSSHIMDIVQKISNRIILLNKGKIVADGSFEKLQEKSKEGSLEEIFSELTGFHEQGMLAEQFVSLMKEDRS